MSAGLMLWLIALPLPVPAAVATTCKLEAPECLIVVLRAELVKLAVRFQVPLSADSKPPFATRLVPALPTTLTSSTYTSPAEPRYI